MELEENIYSRDDAFCTFRSRRCSVVKWTGATSQTRQGLLRHERGEIPVQAQGYAEVSVGRVLGKLDRLALAGRLTGETGVDFFTSVAER
jgi:hypothetical protein